VRRSVAAGGVGVWGRPASIPSWDAPDLGDGLPDLEDANPPGGGPPSADSPGTGSEPVPPRPPSPPSGGSPSVDAPGTGFEPVPPRPFGGAATDGPPSGDPAAGGSAEGPPEEAPVPEVDATQAYLPDFLRDESEAPSDIPGAPPKDAPDLDEDSYTQPA
jgi:hypothetical protein